MTDIHSYIQNVLATDHVPHGTLRETLRAAASEIQKLRDGQGWQDISTAPRDGTEVLAFRPNADVFLAWYGSCENLYLTDAEIDKIGDDSYWAKTWWAVDQDGACRIEDDLEPTHWMPLPSPPTGKEG